MGRPSERAAESREWRFLSESAIPADGQRPFEGSVGQALADARPTDPLGLELAQTVVAAQLFSIGETPRLGRFQLLNRLGAGGKGVVYAAHDPQLDRTVAVKLVRVSAESGSAAMEEGRALARLSHPNVVPVFEVGYSGDHLYIVMELVLGRTLRRWVNGRRLLDVVTAYRQAGVGLAAAHEVGLVHQDFKPENAIMGADGRVRVVDFGLAREAEVKERGEDAAETGRRRGGTPKYMAPEQIAGGRITSATDQYGLCVSLHEALTEGTPSPRGAPPAPLPRWLKAIIDRGCAADPADRFPSMAALVTALGRDPALLRRRWLAAAALAVLSALLFVFGRTTVVGNTSCTAGQARIVSAWGPDGHEAALRSIARFGAYGTSVERSLSSQAREYEKEWATGYRIACEAHQSGVESDALHDRRMACLERGRRALTALSGVVAITEEASLANLVLAARSLPDPGACVDAAALIAVAPPPTAIAGQVAELRNQIASAQVRLAAGQLREARAESEGLVARARVLWSEASHGGGPRIRGWRRFDLITRCSPSNAGRRWLSSIGSSIRRTRQMQPQRGRHLRAKQRPLLLHELLDATLC